MENSWGGEEGYPRAPPCMNPIHVYMYVPTIMYMV